MTIIRTAADAAGLFEPLLAGRTCETMLVAHLDAGRRLLKLVQEDSASEDHIDMPIRAIVSDALRLGSAGLLIAHCHPSGDPSPSEADIAATRGLAQMLSQLGIALHDHLIWGGGEWKSFRALGLL